MPGPKSITPFIPDKVTGCFDLFTRRPLEHVQRADGTVAHTGLERNLHNADTVVAVVTNGSSSAAAAASNFPRRQVMKLSKGKANPALAGEILERKLKG